MQYLRYYCYYSEGNVVLGWMSIAAFHSSWDSFPLSILVRTETEPYPFVRKCEICVVSFVYNAWRAYFMVSEKIKLLS